jgi:hypothetical protein
MTPTVQLIKCLAIKKALLVDDISKELQKPECDRSFAIQETRAEEIGSLFCYPIIHTDSQTIPYVVCISSNKTSLKSDFYELYSTYMEKFALRIALEYSLLTIKGATDDG